MGQTTLLGADQKGMGLRLLHVLWSQTVHCFKSQESKVRLGVKSRWEPLQTFELDWKSVKIGILGHWLRRMYAG